MSEEDIFQDDVDGTVASEGELADWVMGKCQTWRDHYESNYSGKHEEYMRLFRNKWSKEDSERDSERSKLIAPALAQAVESNVAEVEEATFGRGKIFDVRDDIADEQTDDMVFLRKKLHEEFHHARVRSAVGEVLINAAVYGTGIAEITIEERKVYTPGTRPMMDGAMEEIGVRTAYKPIVKLNPVQPKNFLIDPAANTVDDALGCAIDEYVSRHIVEELQEQGVYRDEEFVGEAASEDEIEIDSTVDTRPKDRVRLTKYYGKVPREYLLAEGVDEDEIDEPGHYVEAIVVLGNQSTVLKAIPNPYMCEDRPVVAFQWDVVPGIFWGRGVCEKGYMSQKALDAELRARIDALALTTHPMMAVDATRIPRGHKLEVRPGRMLLTNGAPQEAIMPFNFGQLNGITFQQGQQLQGMVNQATGAAEAQQANMGDTTAAGQSMSQGGVMKRQKRTLVNFQENFLLPFVSKAAFRYMQFNPEEFPIGDYNFIPFSSLGAMAREYEVAQLSQILQVIPPDSPAHGAVLKGIIDHLNVSNREELIAAIEAGNQPNPEAQQAQQQQQQMQMAITQGQVSLLNAQASESQARGQKYNVEAQVLPQEMTLKYADTDGDGKADDKDFEKRIRMAELMLKEREIEGKEQVQLEGAKGKAEAELVKQLTADSESRQQPQPQPPAGVM
jgi:hypothetical protein